VNGCQRYTGTDSGRRLPSRAACGDGIEPTDSPHDTRSTHTIARTPDDLGGDSDVNDDDDDDNDAAADDDGDGDDEDDDNDSRIPATAPTTNVSA